MKNKQKKVTTKKAQAKKPAQKKTVAKKTVRKSTSQAKKPVKTTSKKSAPKKTASKKPVAKKTTTKKTQTKKSAPKKTASMKPVAKKTKTTSNKTVAKKTTTKKTQTKKSTQKKSSNKKTTSKSTGKKKAKPKDSAGVPVGRTLKTKDEYLPEETSKTEEMKDNRWVIVIDKNTKEELAVVKLKSKKTKNTTKLEDYKVGNQKTSYFSHFVETFDNERKPIVIGEKFQQNHPDNDLDKEQVKQIKKKVFNHVKQAQTNKELLKKLKK